MPLRSAVVRSALPTVLLLLGTGSSVAQPALVAPAVLAPHRAVYDLRLVQARDSAGVRGVSGRLVYEFVRKECRIFLLSYRQAMTLDTGEGQGGLIDFRSTSEENDAATEFRFSSLSLVNGQEQTKIDGDARRGDDGRITVRLSSPESKTVSFPAGTLFPTQHLRGVLAAAAENAPIFAADVFDGAEPGDVASPSLATIGPTVPADAQGAPDPKADARLGKLPRHPVTISYFENAAADGEQTPKFTFGAELYANGISEGLKLDYGNFVLEGKLVGLEMLPGDDACPAARN